MVNESNPTCDKRFVKQGILQTVEVRHPFLELRITAPRLAECSAASKPILVQKIWRAARRRKSRRPGRTERSAERIFSDGRAFYQLARGDHRRRRHSQPSATNPPHQILPTFHPPHLKAL
jgi:hypothetical protein